MRGTNRSLARRLVAAAIALSATPGVAQDAPLRVEVSLADRWLWVIAGNDTLRSAPAAVGSDSSLEYQGRRWRFATPRGTWPVIAKDSLPVWVPPEWHYFEVARAQRLVVRYLRAGRPVVVEGARRLEVRGDVVGVSDASGFTPLPEDEEIVFDGALFVPPLGTRNRRIAGELGRYRLSLAAGYSLHGTPWHDSVGRAVTHGCIRLADDDIAWLYANVPVGTPVRVY